MQRGTMHSADRERERGSAKKRPKILERGAKGDSRKVAVAERRKNFVPRRKLSR